MDVRELITQHEKMVLKPYKCTAGKTTIGVGRNLDDKGISESEAMFLFDNDLADTKQACRKYKWFDELSEIRQAAIMDLMFNLGPSRFAGFREFIQAMTAKSYTWAAAELVDSNWYKQVGVRATRIKSMILMDQWPR